MQTMCGCTRKHIYAITLSLRGAYIMRSTQKKKKTNRFWDQDKPRYAISRIKIQKPAVVYKSP